MVKSLNLLNPVGGELTADIKKREAVVRTQLAKLNRKSN